MGKTALLTWLGNQPGYAYCTARQLKNAKPDGRRLLGDASTLVVDALDELSARNDGDAVDVVLQKLGDAGYPRFVLSCRVADWRSATGVAAIQEQYGDIDLLMLHLVPLSDKEIQELLAAELDGDIGRARVVMSHFTNVGLDGLLANPQTLELVARVAKAGDLPNTKAQLFEKAVELLRKEHRDSKADLQPDEASALDAAGAAFAALVLTGSEAITVETAQPAEGEIPLGEVAALPGAERLQAVLGSRLFGTATASNRFSYWHRRIGEYLGGRWLAQKADTAMKRRRLLSLFQSYNVVPASIRGLHAWLAYHDSALAPEILATDPMGVIEYGDADALDTVQAGLLLDSLERLAARNPRFLTGQRYSLKSIVQPPMLERIRSLIGSPSNEFQLRLLVLEAVKSSPIAESLRSDLRKIVLSAKSAFALRNRAVDALVALGGEDWPSIADSLGAAGGDSVRLAIDIVDDVGCINFTSEAIVGLFLRGTRIRDSSMSAMNSIADDVPEEQLDSVLTELATQVRALGKSEERVGDNELTDIGYQLIARRLAAGTVEAPQLWDWLSPFEADRGYHRVTRTKVHELIKSNDLLRRGVQRLVLLDEPGSKTVYQRSWRLTKRSSGLTPTGEDVVALLEVLDPVEWGGARWRDLVELIQHSSTEGVYARQEAKRFVANRPDMLAWVDRLAIPKIPQWEVKQKEEQRKRLAKRAIRWQEDRQALTLLVDEMRHGRFAGVFDPASGYLNLRDLNREAPPHERLIDWLGADLAGVALEGFEAFLQSDQEPTALQVAGSHADSMEWNGCKVIIAAAAERLRRGLGFEGVSNDRLTSCFLELRHSRMDQHANIEGLGKAVEQEMQARGLVEAALSSWIETQLRRNRTSVDRLHGLLWTDVSEARASDLAIEWLTRFSDMATGPEEEMIDRLIESRRIEALRNLVGARLRQSISLERRQNWDAIAFLVDFEAQRKRLESIAASDRDWMWSIRGRVSGRRGSGGTVPLLANQLAFLVKIFRSAFPAANRASGVSTGSTNPWDASEFLRSIASRLADMTSDEAVTALAALHDAPSDGYTDYLRTLRAEQKQKRAEELYQPPLLPHIRAIVGAMPPKTASDLQATLLELLVLVQKRIHADPADPWRGFFTDNGSPHNEERCRDHLLTILGVRPESIDLMPEGHLANDNRADIIALLNGMRIPVEIKGQWHNGLWHSADTQLDRLYTTDYAAERRGIYLVFWFGHNVPEAKKPKAAGRGSRRPRSVEELQSGLIRRSQAAQDGRVVVVVLDLVSPTTA